jgi:hypothetical protein
MDDGRLRRDGDWGGELSIAKTVVDNKERLRSLCRNRFGFFFVTQSSMSFDAMQCHPESGGSDMSDFRAVKSHPCGLRVSVGVAKISSSPDLDKTPTHHPANQSSLNLFRCISWTPSFKLSFVLTITDSSCLPHIYSGTGHPLHT